MARGLLLLLLVMPISACVAYLDFRFSLWGEPGTAEIVESINLGQPGKDSRQRLRIQYSYSVDKIKYLGKEYVHVRDQGDWLVGKKVDIFYLAHRPKAVVLAFNRTWVNYAMFFLHLGLLIFLPAVGLILRERPAGKTKSAGVPGFEADRPDSSGQTIPKIAA